MAATANQEAYRQIIRALSDRIVEAQRPIRILDAIKWDTSVQDGFFAAGAREQPPVDVEYYRKRPLGFNAVAKRKEFHDIDREVTRRLGQFNPLAVLMRRMCDEYQNVVRMLEARGTPEFSQISEDLYGAASDVFHAGDPTLADLGVMMTEALENIDDSMMLPDDEKTISGKEAVSILKQRLDAAFPDVKGGVRVILSDGILADAAAGSDYLKIRKEARFNERDLRVLEVHEGWVHIGTTLNGQEQPVCTFLGKGPPSSTVTQEGLAIIVEIISFASYPARLRRLTNRIRAIDMAEQGATFLDVYRYFLEQGYSEGESYGHASRIFRGSLPDAGPFTKDLAYSKGFILIYNFIRLAVRNGKLDRIPLLFCGKTTLEDIKTLSQLVEEGLVSKPRFLPPQFRDLNALTAWMCYSNFLNRLSLEKIEVDYANIL